MTPRKPIAPLALATLVVLAAVLLVRAHPMRGVADFGTQATVVARHLTTTTDSVSTSAVDQRYRMRREAVASMRADLLRFARAESLFIGDSGIARSTFLPGTPYDVRPTKGNMLEGFRFGDTTMTATARNITVTTIMCTVSVPYRLDTAARPPHFVVAPPHEPVCTQPR